MALAPDTSPNLPNTGDLTCSLGGYYIFEVPDLDAALFAETKERHFAAMIPSAAYGTIEVRPVMDYDA